MARLLRPLHGLVLFDKPLELSSNTALQKVRFLFQAEKAGHTGTLDPLATGLLPVCFGEATKFSTALLDADKRYCATLKLGETTTTGDREGEVLQQRAVNVTLEQVQHVLAQFVGAILQLPPMHSALKHQGRPLYEYIRNGQTIDRPSRQVVIHELLLREFEGDRLVFEVCCSKGTYVRTLAEDIGEALGCGAHLSALRRTGIAHLSLDQAHDWAQLQQFTMEERQACVLPIDHLMPHLPMLQLDEVAVRRLAQGQRLASEAGLADGVIRLYGPQGFVGLGRLDGRRLSPERMCAFVALSAAQVTA